MPRPNVLIVLCDQLAREYVGAYGNGVARTPHMDGLAAEGALLTNAYVPLPVCSPARASMYTGLYPHQHLLHINGHPDHAWHTSVATLSNRPVLPESVPSLGQAFKAAGYRMGYTGNWHMGDDETAHHGWTDYWRTYRYWKNGRDYYVQHLEDVGLAETFRDEHRRFSMGSGLPAGVVPSGRSAIPREHARTSWTVDQAIAFVEGRDSRPWMLTVSIKDPHPPVIMPDPFADLVSPEEVELPASLADDQLGKPDAYRRCQGFLNVRNMREPDWRRLIAHYHGLVAHVDAEFGRLLACLDAQGLRDDTIVILLSDHGEMMGAHRMMAKGPALYEESIGIPFILRWPGEVMPSRPDGMFSTIDLNATLGGLCGVEVDAGEGLDQSAVLRGTTPAVRDAVFVEFYASPPDVDDWMFAKTIRTPRWKLNMFLFDRSELYDLEADPNEMCNLIDDAGHAEIRRDLCERIVEWAEATADPITPLVERAARRLTLA
ncbi:MAG: sulfatase-like hydrolase/transferase [Chloroflexota bacterium]|nr:sulfatase-like hydrolase/transferase [Chloroflexota bacterium]MDE2898135.1 sulfatase-like hydrolase/transferase [Chloroflexota bacterium]